MNKVMHDISVLGMMVMTFIAVVSCSLVSFDFNEYEERGYVMHLNRDTVYIMEGDTFTLSPLYTPELHGDNVFWASTDSVLKIDGNNIIASKVGDTYVKAYSSYQNLTDSCYVNVMPKWRTPIYDYPYETIVNANVMIDDNFFDPSKMKVAAFINGECRGLGIPKDYFGTTIIQFRICGNPSEHNEQIRFRLYIHDELFCEYFPQTIPFDGATHGTISSLVVLKMDR